MEFSFFFYEAFNRNLKSQGAQYLTQTVICETHCSLSKAIVMYVGVSVRLTLYRALNASHSSEIKPVTGTCHLQFGPLQSGNVVCELLLFPLIARSQGFFREDHRDVHRRNPILPCFAEESDFDLSLTQYKCSSGNVQAGGFL